MRRRRLVVVLDDVSRIARMELRQPASGDESNRDAASVRVANGVANRAI
jgi:hypothetical protein